jgi:phage tail sheath protein FI
MGHGVNILEQPTGVKPPARVSAGLTAYVGTAPINSVDLTNVNKAKIAYTLAEAVGMFGPSTDDFANWTLHEAIKAHFSLFSVGPIVLINVCDPANAAHKAHVVDQSHQLVDGEVQLQVYGGPDEPMLGVLQSTVVVKKAGVTKTLGTDYTLAFDDDGFMVVTRVSTGSIGASDVITATFDYLDPSGVTADDIIGGYSGGQYTGLEVVRQVYPGLRLPLGFISSPKYSQIPEVASRMAVLAHKVTGFRCMALTDLSTDPGEIASFADAAAWKSDNGYTSVDQAALWPLGKIGSDVYHASTLMACIANTTDADVEGIPFVSPSNKSALITSAVDDDGNEILLEEEQANALNAQGIVTLLNGFFGWKLWGNRTAGYPSTTDPKDAFISIRRMFNWIGNTIILTTSGNVDNPVNLRLVRLVLNTLGTFLNGLVPIGALVDGKIEFRKEENPATDLSDGKVTWHVTLTPPPPAEEMTFVLEFDPAALQNLFA